MTAKTTKLSKIVALKKREPLFDKNNEVLAGTITHKAMELLIKETPPEALCKMENTEKYVEKAIDLFIHPESPKREEIKKYVTIHVRRLTKALKVFLKNLENSKVKILSEMNIWCRNQIRRPDLVLLLKEEKKILVIDFKTGTKLTEDEEKNYKNQLEEYTEAIKSIFPEFSTEALILFSPFTTKPPELPHQEGDYLMVKVDG